MIDDLVPLMWVTGEKGCIVLLPNFLSTKDMVV